MTISAGVAPSVTATPDGGVAVVAAAADDVVAARVERHLGAHGGDLGRHIGIDEAASWAGTISYELLTRLGSRYARLYTGLESEPAR